MKSIESAYDANFSVELWLKDEGQGLERQRERMHYGTHDIILLAIVVMDKEGFAFCFATSSIFVVEEEG